MGARTTRDWTPDEEDFIITKYKKLPAKDIARILGRTPASIYKKWEWLAENNRLTREKKPKKKEPGPKIISKKTTLAICPKCKGGKVNAVENMHYSGAKYFCINCMSEFDKYGRQVEPIY